MNKIELARLICREAHSGQVDKAGKPYYTHPYTVAEKCKTRDEKIVAYLHDVVEDTNISIELLRLYGFSDKIIDALKLLTHNKEVPYFDYIKRIKTNKLAMAVKRNDLLHNSDLSRLKEITEEDIKRVEKYKESLRLLNE